MPHVSPPARLREKLPFGMLETHARNFVLKSTLSLVEEIISMLFWSTNAVCFW
jgi:hypothetical protein